MTAETRQCSRCFQDKPLTAFAVKAHNKRPDTMCRPCRRSYMRRYDAGQPTRPKPILERDGSILGRWRRRSKPAQQGTTLHTTGESQ